MRAQMSFQQRIQPCQRRSIHHGKSPEQNDVEEEMSMRILFDDSDKEKSIEDEITERISGLLLAIGLATGVLTLIQGIVIAVLIAHISKIQFMIELLLR